MEKEQAKESEETSPAQEAEKASAEFVTKNKEEKPDSPSGCCGSCS